MTRSGANEAFGNRILTFDVTRTRRKRPVLHRDGQRENRFDEGEPAEGRTASQAHPAFLRLIPVDAVRLGAKLVAGTGTTLYRR